MLKKVLLLTVIALFTFSTVYAQSSMIKEHTKKIVTEDFTSVPSTGDRTVTPMEVYDTRPVVNPAEGDVVGITQYDYFSNSVIRDQVTHYMGVPHMAVMLQSDLDVDATRYITYITSDGSEYTSILPWGEVRKGWPHIDVSLSGEFEGAVALVGHVPCELALFDGSEFIKSEFEADTDPSLQFSGNNVFLATSGNRVTFQFYKTMDLGLSFENWDSISAFSPSPIYWTENGGVEVGMSKSFDETQLLMFGTNVGDGHVYDGVPAENADNAWVIYSNDAGDSWTGEMIGADGDASIFPDATYPEYVDTITYTVGEDEFSVFYDSTVSFQYAPLFENFGQMDAVVTNDGDMHAVLNGYGLSTAEVILERPDGSGTMDTILIAGPDVYPIVYWNSKAGTWRTISDEMVDLIPDTILADMRPGNGLGQSYPGIAASEDGQVLLVTWTSAEFVDGVVAPENVNVGPESGTFWTDTYYSYSLDGGETWSYGGVLVGEPNTSETLIHPAQHLEYDGENYIAHLVYLNDTVDGVAVFDESAKSDCEIVYKTFIVPDEPTVSVEDEYVATDFTLEQNYPNPFNPATQISFTLPEASKVTLTVFDVLGREVATIVDQNMNAGQHTVNFDASELTSGMYIYTITAGNYTASKKMMLLK